MNSYFTSLSLEERMRVDTLEPFDEFEELEQKCCHYVLLCACSERLSVLANQIIPENIEPPSVYKELSLDISAVQFTSASKTLARYIISFRID